MPDAKKDSKRYVAAGLALGLLALVVYSNSFGAGLVLDAKALIAGDTRIQSWDPASIKLIFTHEYWWPEITSDLYRPLTTLSYWVNYTVLGGGTRVLGYHVVNFALHWANAVLVLLIVDRFSKRFAIAIASAALFAVHPVNTESVTNIVGRADLLATLAVLFGGWCYARATAQNAIHPRAWLAAMGASAIAGVFMKETAIAIGAFVLLYDAIWRWPAVPGKTFGEKLRAALVSFRAGYVALAPAALAMIVVRVVIHRQSPLVAQQFADNPIAGASRFVGVMTAFKVIARYVGLLVFPHTLSSDYSYNQVPLFLDSPDPWENLQAAIGLALVVGIVWFAWRVRRKNQALAWGAAFFLLAMLPTSNLLVPIGSIMAERFLYLPLIGFCVVAAYALVTLSERIARARSVAAALQPRAALAGAAIVTTAFGIRAHVRNDDWHDDISLWRSAVVASPASFRTYKGYASALLLTNQDEATVDAAIASSEHGLAILDNPPLSLAQRDVGMYVDLGVYYRVKAQRLKQRGQGAEAGAFLGKSVDVLNRAREADDWFNSASKAARIARGWKPSDVPDVGSAPLYHELGDTYIELGDMARAQAAARYAQHLAPDAPRGYQIDGVSAFYARHPDGAAVEFAIVLLLDPSKQETWENLGSCFQAMAQPPPITEQGGRRAFDLASPVGKQLVAAAGASLVQSFEAAKRQADAQRWRARLTSEYGVPASVFAPSK